MNGTAMDLEVLVNLSADKLIGSIAGGSGEMFAFYVHRNKEKIGIQWYSPSRTINFDHGRIPGIYNITAFSKEEDGTVTMKGSSDHFLFGEKVPFESIEHGDLVDGPLLIRSGNHDFHCLWSRGTENRLFILLTAAISRKNNTQQVFNRWRWRDRFPGHVLCIADPTLSMNDEIEIGWYLGTEYFDATDDLANMVENFAHGLALQNQDIVPYGSSAGGFAAMTLAARLNCATAVAINPQTDITKYLAKQVAIMLNTCFPGLSEREVHEKYSPRINAAQALTHNQSRVILAQNIKDAGHWEPHFLPFASTMNMPTETGVSENGRFFSIVYSHENGHGSEPDEVFSDIIQLTLSDSWVDFAANMAQGKK